MKKRFTAPLAIACAAVMGVTALAGCAGSNGSSSKALDASLAYAKSQVSKFAESEIRLSATFADHAFSQANGIAMLLSDKTTAEEFEKIARYFYLDSITVADESGTITACYPEDDKGKTLKQTEDKKTFNRIVKGITVKSMTDPAPVEGSDAYSLMVGVQRADGAAGAVVVGYQTEAYADVAGAHLAETCGANTIVLRGDAVLGATVSGVEKGATLDSLGIKSDDIAKGDFNVKIGDKDFHCKAEKLDDFTVICAE